jgi:hypothetical protein
MNRYNQAIYYFLLLFGVASYSLLQAQNYAPVPNGMKIIYEFSHSHTGNIWEEVFIDSIIPQGTDTLFILNGQTRKVSSDQECNSVSYVGGNMNFLTEQAGNLGKEILKKGADTYSLINPFGDTLELRVGQNIGYYWNARPHMTGFDTARVLAYSYKNIVENIWDSVMTISWQNRKIEISQLHGIVYFDGFMDLTCPPYTTINQPIGFPRYQLSTPVRMAGISGNQFKAGYSTAFPADTYDFTPGDIFSIRRIRYKHSSLAEDGYIYYHILEDSGIVNGRRTYKAVYKKNNYLGASVTSLSFPITKPGQNNSQLKYIFSSDELINIPSNNAQANFVNILQPFSPITGPEIIFEPGLIVDTCMGKVRLVGGNVFEGGITLKMSHKYGFNQQSYWSSYLDGDRTEWYLACFRKHDDTTYISPCIPLSEDEATKVEKDVLIYPNPSKKELSIQLPSGNIFQSSISLYNMQGRLLREYPVNRESGIQLNLPELPSGIYWINFVSNEQIMHGKIIIEN